MRYKLFIAMMTALLSLCIVAPAASAGGPFEWGLPCEYTRSAFIDTIKFPDQIGLSHEHDFCGSNFTRHTDTFAELNADDVTSTYFNNGAFPKADQSLYWTQALYRSTTGKKVPVKLFIPYYRCDEADNVCSQTTNIPKGFKYIAGNADATSPQKGIADWGCGGGGGANNYNPYPVDCDPNSDNPYVKLHITFPSCIVPGTLDSDNHQSHAVYPTNSGCPASHPKLIPSLELIVRYDTSNGDNLAWGSNLEPIEGAHADFINGWDANVQRTLIDRCFTPTSRCNLKP